MAKSQSKKNEASSKPGFLKRTAGKAKTGVINITSFDSIKSNAIGIKEGVKRILYVRKTPERIETFSQAVERLNLTEKDINERRSNFFRLALIIGCVTFFCLLYTIYLLWQARFASALLALTVTTLSFATAARYHFWYFQVKNRKLGCTINEWLNAKVSGEEK